MEPETQTVEVPGEVTPEVVAEAPVEAEAPVASTEEVAPTA